MKIFIMIVALVGMLFAEPIKLEDNNASDPVYILPLKNYPKWLCEATLKNGKKIQFVSVKSMMQVYFHQDYFKRHKFISDDIDSIYVQDYLTTQKIKASSAVYVFGSHLVGPHGDDLVPFENEQKAKIFMLKHGGTKILPFERLSKGLIKYLDM